MRTLGPFPVPAVDLDVLIGSQSGLAVGVEITNLSGTLLRIQVGSHQEWLPAYRVQRYSMRDEDSVHIVNAGAEIAGAPENQILIVAAYTNDAPDYVAAFPGTYPQDISRATTVAISGGAVNATIVGTPSVTIASGTVSATISGTPNVNVQSQSATLNVQFPSAQLVSISGTPSVSISSGSVSITGTPNINVQSQSITLEVNHPWLFLNTHVVAGSGAGSFLTSAVPTDAQQMSIGLTDEFNGFLGFSVRGHQTGNWYLETTAAATFTVSGYFVVPINGAADSTYDIAWSNTLVNTAFTMNLYESALPPGFAALGPQPQAASIPVTISPDQAIGKAGQQAQTLSAPVVLAQDQIFLKSNGSQRGLEMQLAAPVSEVTSAPAAGSNASITLAAVVGIKWILYSTVFTLCQTGTLAVVSKSTITDNGTAVHTNDMAIVGTANTVDREVLNQGWGNLFANAPLVISLGAGSTSARPNVSIAAGQR